MSSSDENRGEVIDGTTGRPDPLTPGSFGKDGRRIDLSNLRDVRIELARLYRMMDAGDITDTAGGKRAFVLRTIADVIALSELEQRIEELEDRTEPVEGRAALPTARSLQ